MTFLQCAESALPTCTGECMYMGVSVCAPACTPNLPMRVFVCVWNQRVRRDYQGPLVSPPPKMQGSVGVWLGMHVYKCAFLHECVCTTLGSLRRRLLGVFLFATNSVMSAYLVSYSFVLVGGFPKSGIPKSLRSSVSVIELNNISGRDTC